MFLLSSLPGWFVPAWMFLFQATPSATPLPVTVVTPKHFWPETFVEWMGTVSALAIIAGGIWALRSYREGQRLKAAETLLTMEEEFRVILPTYELIENPAVYEAKIKPLLQAVMNAANLSDEQIKLLSDLDRCLRFLFLCSVLNQDLAVEQNALMRAYHHYVDILARMTDDDNSTPDLADYIKVFYPTLCKWTEENEGLLTSYRAGETWKAKPFWKL
jgi:hypothetical protein